MNRIFLAVVMAGFCFAQARADNAAVEAAQTSIGNQINAFRAGDNETAYSYAAPAIKQLFPTLDIFMHMVESAYQPVWHPQSYAFGRAEEPSPTSVIQEVEIVGPDGKNYTAIYTLERQPDGVYRITSVSLKASNLVGA